MKKAVLILVLGFGFLASCDVGNFETVLKTPHFSIFYSGEFAKRFSLPKEKAVVFKNRELKAMAIGIQKIDNDYECNIHLYHGSSMKLYSPNNQASFVGKQIQEHYFAKNINGLDYRYYDGQVSRNSGRAYFRSKSLSTLKTGTSSTVAYSSYKKEFLPDLNVASFRIGCGFLDARNGEAELLVQKEGVANYKLINDDPLDIRHPENSYLLDVPLALLKTVQPMIDRINALPVEPAASNVSVQYGVKN